MWKLEGANVCVCDHKHVAYVCDLELFSHLVSLPPFIPHLQSQQWRWSARAGSSEEPLQGALMFSQVGELKREVGYGGERCTDVWEAWELQCHLFDPLWLWQPLLQSESVVSHSLTHLCLKDVWFFFFYLNLVTNSVKNWYRTSINFRAVSIFSSMIRKDKVTTFKPYFEVFLGKLT